MQIAGVEDEPEPAPAPKKASSISGNQWAQQLEKSYASSGGGSGARRSSEPRHERNTMVNIVGYNGGASSRAPAQQLSRHEDYNKGSSFGYDNIAGVLLACIPAARSKLTSTRPCVSGPLAFWQTKRLAFPEPRDMSQACHHCDGCGISATNVSGSRIMSDLSFVLAGIAGIRNTGFAGDRANSGSTYTDSFVKVDYPAYPSLTPTPAQPAQSGNHSQYGAAQNHGGTYASSNHSSYMQDYGSHGQQQQPQEYSASPYQPHGQPTSYSDYSAPNQQNPAASGAPSYNSGTSPQSLSCPFLITVHFFTMATGECLI